MAITKNVTLRNGLFVPNAYIIIEARKSLVEFDGCRVTVWVFISESYKSEGLPVVSGQVILPANSQDYFDYFDEEMLERERVTDTTQSYKYVTAKGNQLDAALGFKIDWKS